MEIRISILKTMMYVLFLGIIFRMGYLQLHQSDRYLRQSEDNRLRVNEINPVRGLIYDRKGRILVENTASYSIVARPRSILNSPESVSLLRAIFSEDTTNGWEDAARKYIDRRPEIRLKRDISFAGLAATEANKYFLPGIDIRVESKRLYPYRSATHIIGYLGEISASELEQYQGFRTGDIMGKKGIEKSYNLQLFGQRGCQVVEVDVAGRTVRSCTEADNYMPINGCDIHLTIDLELQMLAEQLMSGLQGAVVAMDPNNGDILAMASAPDYDPSIFSGLIEQEQWEILLNHPGKSLLNRCIQGTYPPGSTIKMAILAAALEEKVVTPNNVIFCPGGMQMGNRYFNCWKEGGHGNISAVKAIEQSCDTYFYNMGLELGMDKMAEYLRKFRFGVQTGIDLENENLGLVPDSLYMNRRYGSGKWSRGHLLNTSIGQGDLLVTPLQLAVFCSAIANGGYLVQPHLLKGMVYHEPDQWEGYKPTKKKIDGISSETFDILKRGMLRVVQGEFGTAHWLYDPRINAAGKTGTSQNPHGEDHALFIGFAPFEKPAIAVCVVVEHGEHGSTAAAPIVMKLMRLYLQIEELKQPSQAAKIVG